MKTLLSILLAAACILLAVPLQATDDPHADPQAMDAAQCSLIVRAGVLPKYMESAESPAQPFPAISRDNLNSEALSCILNERLPRAERQAWARAFEQVLVRRRVKDMEALVAK